MTGHPSVIGSHAWIMPGIPPLGGILVLGNLLGGYSDRPDRNCLRE